MAYNHFPPPPTMTDSSYPAAGSSSGSNNNNRNGSSSASRGYTYHTAPPPAPVASYYGGQSMMQQYAGPPDPYAAYGSSSATDARNGGFDASMAQQSSIYTPEGAAASGDAKQAKAKAEGRTTVLRKGGGEVWEDRSLMEWDPSHFRLFIGDLDPALSDDLFLAAFKNARYPSFVKAKIVREKHTNKGKGFGFVSYSDPEDFLKVWKEMNGKYVGTRPVKISKATTGVAAVNIGQRKAAMFDLKNKKASGTVPYERAKAAEAAIGPVGSGGFGPERNRKSYIRR